MKTILKTLGLCMAIFAWAMVAKAQDTAATTGAQQGDLDFASKATASNNFELQAANIALSKSQNQNIKQYAQMIVDDHTAVGNELSTLVKNKNWQLNTADDQNYKDMIDKLNNADAATFDSVYTDMMVKSHQDAINLFKDANTGTATTDADLRKFAGDKVPRFEKHLDQIKTIKPTSSTMPNGGTSNSSIPGIPTPGKTKIPKPTLK